jgi:hypothetical protein
MMIKKALRQKRCRRQRIASCRQAIQVGQGLLGTIPASSSSRPLGLGLFDLAGGQFRRRSTPKVLLHDAASSTPDAIVVQPTVPPSFPSHSRLVVLQVVNFPPAQHIRPDPDPDPNTIRSSR